MMSTPSQQWTVRTVSVTAREFLKQKGVPAPRLDSELLLAHVLGRTRLELFMDFDRLLNEEELAKYREAVKLRSQRVPLQHITGYAEFMSLRFKVSPAVMIPRPETELVVERALRVLKESSTGVPPVPMDTEGRARLLPSRSCATGVQPVPVAPSGCVPGVDQAGTAETAVLRSESGIPVKEDPCCHAELGSASPLHSDAEVLSASGVSASSVVDLGTGSGNIAVAIAKYAQAVRVFAVDCSAEALEVARENAARHRVDGRITFALGDLFAPLRGIGLEGTLELVVSNPPYVGLIEEGTLQPEVLRDPRIAVFAGEDALVFYRRIAVEAPEMLAPGGHVVVELGAGQRQAVEDVFRSTGRYSEFDVESDLAGIERVFHARCLMKNHR